MEETVTTSSDHDPQDRPSQDPTPGQPPPPPPPDFGAPEGSGQPPPPDFGAPEAPSYGQMAAPGYAQPKAPGYGQPDASQSNGMGVAALVVAIVAVLACWVPFLGGIIAIVGVILGFVARGNVQRGQATNGGMALTAIILSALALIVNIVIVAGLLFAVTQVGDEVQDIVACSSLPAEEQQACLDDIMNN